MVRLLAPILPFTTEEIWQKMPVEVERQESVHFTLFPEVRNKWLDDNLAARWERLLAVRDEVLKVLEDVRKEKVIGNSLEAAVHLYVKEEDLKQLLQNYKEDLRTLFIVSQVTLHDSDQFEALKLQENEILGSVVGVSKAEGDKCELCWNYSPTVGQDDVHPSLCERCICVITTA
jgi:isoleucyl-tRNA synthetase